MKPLPLLALTLAVIPALGAGYQFPSAASSKSPDGKWELTCKNPANKEPAAEPLLLLRKVGGGTFGLRRVGRGCDTLWSPNSSRIAVTDWWASDRSDVFIHSLAGGVPSSRVVKVIPKGGIPDKELCGHRYFEAVTWLDDHRLEIKLTGHTDEAPVYGFEHEYIFDLASGKFQEIGKNKQTTSQTRSVNQPAPITERILR